MALKLNRYHYVKAFEVKDIIMPFQRITIKLKWANRKQLLTSDKVDPEIATVNYPLILAAGSVMKVFPDIKLSFIYDNICSFVLNENVYAYKGRGSKFITTMASLLSSHVTFSWNKHFPMIPLSSAISIEGDIIRTPNEQSLSNFLTIHQQKGHLNNLKRVCMHHLVNDGAQMDEAKAQVVRLSELELSNLLFLKYAVNYNSEPLCNKRGAILIREKDTNNVLLSEKDAFCRINNEIVAVANNMPCSTESQFTLENTTPNDQQVQYLTKHTSSASILPDSWIVVRIDGKGFSKFTKKHSVTKPSDIRLGKLFVIAAKKVMQLVPSICFSYGQSDEFSFILKLNEYGENFKYNLMTKIVSLFSSLFVTNWSDYCHDMPLQYLPSFDARVVIYPNESIRDYLNWRQLDCHINNIHNTCFWNLILKKQFTNTTAGNYLAKICHNEELRLELLKKDFNIDYHTLDSLFRKGTILYKVNELPKVTIVENSCDIISDDFWNKRPWILENKKVANEMKQDVINGHT